MFNKVILIGNLTRDPQLNYSGIGSAIAKFGLAVNRQWKDRNSGEKKEEVMYIDINIFGRSAEIANQHLAKGKKILVEGRLVLESWVDQTGQKRSRHSIDAESFQFLDSKGDGATGNYNQSQQQKNDNRSPFDMDGYNGSNGRNQSNSDFPPDDDIPFAPISKRISMLL